MSNLLDEDRIILALSYKNENIVEKYSLENNLDKSIGEEYFKELKKYLYLCSSINGTLAPSKEIDKIWHTFILFTKDYREYCLNYLGKFVDHTPQLNNSLESSQRNYLADTIDTYEYVFGRLKNEIWKVEFYNYRTDDFDVNDFFEDEKSVESKLDYYSPSDDEIKCVFSGDCYSGYGEVKGNPDEF